jgi:hypothetical protein
MHSPGKETPPSMNDLHDLELLLRSRVPLITVETRDERRVARLFSRLARISHRLNYTPASGYDVGCNPDEDHQTG